LGSSRPIFAVSDKQALEAKLEGKGKEDPIWQNSNFSALENWISTTVTHSDERGGKLRSIAQTGQVVLQGIQAKLRSALDLLKADQERITSIRGSLGVRKEQTLRQIGGFIREMEMAYDDCRQRGEKLLEERLGFLQTFKMIFSGGRWEKDFQDKIESDVQTKVREKIEHALELLEADLRLIWQELQDKVQAQFDADTRKQARPAMPGFVSQRGAILQKLQLTLLEQMSDAKIKQQLQEWFGETARWLRVPAGVAAAGGIFTIIAALAHTAILDVTRTVAGLAAFTGTVDAVFRRRHILREYRLRMDEKRKELAGAVATQWRDALTPLYHNGGQTFAPLDRLSRPETPTHPPSEERAQKI